MGEEEGQHTCAHCSASVYMYTPTGFKDYECESCETVEAGALALKSGALAVDFDDVEVDDANVGAIISALSSKECKCAALSLYDNELSPESVSELAKALRLNTTVKVLNLSGYPVPIEILRGAELTDDSFQDSEELTPKEPDVQLSRYLASDIRGIDLSVEKYKVADAVVIGHFLSMNTQLNILNLSSSQLDDDCIEYLSIALSTNNTLLALGLAHNKVGCGGAKAIADALCVNKTLDELDLDDNSIGLEGTKALAEMLRVNRMLTSLKIRQNDVDPAIFVEAIDVNKTLNNFACDGMDEDMLKRLGFEKDTNETVLMPK